MSFSSDVKEELSKISNLANKELVKAEFVGYLLTNNLKVEKNRIRFSTENEYNINRFGKLLSNLGIADYKIDLQGKTYVIKSRIPKGVNEVLLVDNHFILVKELIGEKSNDEMIEKALIRGSFLGGGTLNNPEKKYHIEINFGVKENALIVKNIFEKYNIDLKELDKKEYYALYSKAGEDISNILAFIGANSSVLKFEEIRVLREMRNNVNRQVNCETANINKTISAAVKQIENIKYIKSKNKMDLLNDGLKEVAKIRLENPDATLIELGKMLSSPLGKSGINHRLKAIDKIAEELRNKEEE